LRIHTTAGPRGGVHPCRCASAIGAAAVTAEAAMATGAMAIEAGAGMEATATAAAVATTGAGAHAAARVMGQGTDPHLVGFLNRVKRLRPAAHCHLVSDGAKGVRARRHSKRLY
jgi:hypothetical protein